MNTHHLVSGCSLLALIISMVACSGPAANPEQSPIRSGTTTSENASPSASSISSEATPADTPSPTSASSVADPVATNDLILVEFPAAEGPSNHDGTFTGFDYESQIGFKNPKDETVTIGSVEIVNVTGAAFSVKIDRCTGRTLPKESACEVWVQLKPPTPPGRSVAYTGQLIINMPAHNTYQVLDLVAETVVTATSSPPTPGPTSTPTPTLPTTPISSSPVP